MVTASPVLETRDVPPIRVRDLEKKMRQRGVTVPIHLEYLPPHLLKIINDGVTTLPARDD